MVAGADDDMLNGGAGASFNNINATQWSIDYNAGESQEIITLENSATVDLSDYVFS